FVLQARVGEQRLNRVDDCRDSTFDDDCIGEGAEVRFVGIGAHAVERDLVKEGGGWAGTWGEVRLHWVRSFCCGRLGLDEAIRSRRRAAAPEGPKRSEGRRRAKKLPREEPGKPGGEFFCRRGRCGAVEGAFAPDPEAYRPVIQCLSRRQPFKAEHPHPPLPFPAYTA